MNPDVIFIGAPRAGSSWFWKNISNHPNVWTFPYKGILHLTGKNEAKGRRKKVVRHFSDELAKKKTFSQKLYNFFYFNFPVSNFWYKILLNQGKGKLIIDVCPTLSNQHHTKHIKRVQKLAPNAKIILALRNPIDRTWSQAKFYYKNKGIDINTVAENEIIDFFNRPKQYANADYPKLLDLYTNAFGAEHIHYYFYDEIKETPLIVLEQICTFLNLNVSENYFEEAEIPVNISNNLILPEKLHKYLSIKYLPLLIDIENKFKGYSTKWLNEAENTLSKNNY